MRWEMIVGLEVHAQMLTKTKIFCGCSTAFGSSPNTQVCPVCLGLPGALPVLNSKVVQYAVKVGLATNCTINQSNRFARKNYFYPDLPKGYQISQFEKPILEFGHLDIEDDAGAPKRIGITRIHMEEDAGKLLHPEAPGADYSLVDLNRACVPLLEIVSEPDIRSAGEAVRYVRKLREILVYLGVCDGNMNEGSLRVDANVSVRPVGQEKFGTRTETKNVNSFKFLEQAINYERQRQIEVLEDGGEIVQETRLFDAVRGITVSMRSKEEAHDYRYFPDPDLLPVVISQSEIEDARASLPELPDAKRERFVSTLGLPKLDAEVLCQTREMADFFESVVALHNDPKAASNWMMGGVLKNMNRDGMETLARLPVKASHIAGMLDLMKSGAISSKIAKDVFEEMWTSGKSAAEIVKEKGLTQISDTSEIEAIVDAIIAKNPSEFERLKGGDQKLTGFFVGQIMRESKGKANPGMVNDLLKKKMEG